VRARLPAPNAAALTGAGADTAFKQQRLKAWQPILTPKTVLPTFFFLGVLFAPIGAALLWGSGKVTEIAIDYTHCDDQPPATDLSAADAFHDVSSYSYKLKSGESSTGLAAPQFAFLNPSEGNQTCVVRFTVPYDLEHSVLLYYKLSNFFQNHRRYVKSLDSGQLTGTAKTSHDLDKAGDCKPLATRDKKPIYPCGLIANSQFNGELRGRIPFHIRSHTPPDTLGPILTPVNAGSAYTFSESGIAWPGEKNKYTDKPDYAADWTQVAVPPNWDKRYPDGYSADNFPKLASDEHFQNWMRTAGLPTFTKLCGRNDHDTLTKGTYQIAIGMSEPPRHAVLGAQPLTLPRLPREAVQRLQGGRHLDCLVDRGEEPVPGLGVHWRRRPLLPSRHPRNHPPPRKAAVRAPFLLLCWAVELTSVCTGNWGICPCSRGTGDPAWLSGRIYLVYSLPLFDS
jgi:hypothetical protein